MESQRGWHLAAPFYVMLFHFATLTCRNINIIHWMTFSKESHFRATAAGNDWILRSHRTHHYELPNTHQDCLPLLHSQTWVFYIIHHWALEIETFQIRWLSHLANVLSKWFLSVCLRPSNDLHYLPVCLYLGYSVCSEADSKVFLMVRDKAEYIPVLLSSLHSPSCVACISAALASGL